MCKISRQSKAKSATGYKIVSKVDGKYYSIGTGVEYMVGDVPKLPNRGSKAHERANLIDELFVYGIFDRKSKGFVFNRQMCDNRLTAVIMDYERARSYLDKRNNPLGNNLIILKMTISGNIHQGSYAMTGKVMLGNHIDKMVEKSYSHLSW